MTNSNGGWLDRLENDLETVKNIMLTLARRAEGTDQRIDRLVESQDRTQRQLDQLSITVDRAVESFTTTQTSIAAALERQDIILDYLMRRDRNGEDS